MGGPLPSGTPPPRNGSDLDRLRARIANYFPIYETRIGPQSVIFAVHVDAGTLEKKFQRLADELWVENFVPVLRRQTGEYFIEVVPRPPRPRGGITVNLILLIATIGSTVFTGALIWLSFVGGQSLSPEDFLWGGLFFALPLMAMLGCHELAHYVVARRYQLDASLPYFIPIPPPFLFGTLGAFISIRQPFTDRKALFDIGAAGPLAGFAIAVPVTLAGIYLSITSPAPGLNVCGPTFLGTSYSALVIGTPLIWSGFTALFPAGLISLHPLALAGWVGIFVTAINLLPAGQLDGGHIWRALLGDRTRYLSYGIAMFLVVVGLFFYLGWLVFAFLVILLGLRHPPPLNDFSPLGWRRGLVGVAVAAVLISGFTLVPVAAQTGQIGLGTPSAIPWAHAPGYSIAGNLTVPVQNQDLVPHGFVFATSVTGVTLANGSVLNASQRSAWAATSNWTFNLGGTLYFVNQSASATAPGGAGYYALNSTDTIPVEVFFGNPQPAQVVQFTFTASEVCPPPGSGPQSTTFSLVAP